MSGQAVSTDGVDVVYTWVNGTDPAYMSERRKFMTPGEKSQSDPNRFRNNGELRYSIRSVLKNTDWVRKIFIVTNNQTPDFIDVTNPQVEIVSIDQIVDRPDALPSFNSMAIECCLHRIPGLADRFVYLNDDFFFGRPVSLAQLGGSHGQGLFLMEHKQLASDATDSYQSYLRSSDEALSRVYGSQKRLNGCHVPQLFDRNLCFEVASLWRDEIAATVAQRFRSVTDVVFRLLYAYNVLYTHFGKADAYELASKHPDDARLPRPQDYMWIPYGDRKHDVPAMLQRVRDEPFLFFCLQDHMWGDLGEQVSALEAFMSGMFDSKSAVEL